MKKNIICAAFAIASALPAIAQNGKGDGAKDWFIGAGAGINFGLDGREYDGREMSHNGAGTSGDFYVGKYFNPSLGFRIGYQGFGISNSYTDYGKDKFCYAHADLICRAGEVFTPYLHAGYAHINTGTAAGGVGVMLPIRLGPHVSIIPDIKATALDGRAFTGGGSDLGLNLSATVGVQVNLGRSRSKKAASGAAPALVPLPAGEAITPQRVDTVYVRDTVLVAQKDLDATVLFATNSYVLTGNAKAILEDVAAFMKKYPGVRAVIEGHTDSTGVERINVPLGNNRAKAVASYLVSKGVPASSISYVGYSSVRPVDTNKTAAGRAHNRRAEIHLSIDKSHTLENGN